jgi:GDSL-like lipase/acylhydrolase family protein
MPTQRLLVVPLVAFAAACADSPVAPSRIEVGNPSFQQSEGRGVFQRYVAIGTSISMGVIADGVYSGSQVNSWPAQLARMGDREITQPLIQFPGCRSPWAAPLGGGVRLSGEPIFGNAAALSCAPLEPGVTIPAQNTALSGARARDALFTTPQNILDAGNAKMYGRVLPAGMTQLDVMEAENPKLVSVEFGVNEVLSAISGIALVGPPPLPVENPATFATQMHQIFDRIDAVKVKHVLVVGLPRSPFEASAFRTGAEVWANAQALLFAFNVAVQPDCIGANAGNQIFVVARIPLAIQAGLTARALGQPAVPLSCAGAGPTTQDFVLTAAEQTVLNTVVAQMNAALEAEAQARGYAFVSLDALYGAPGVRVPLNVVALVTSPTPFGPFMSLDGLHPSAAGQTLIAQAAAQALNARYDLGIPTP